MHQRSGSLSSLLPQHTMGSPSRRLVASYILDWIVIVIIAGIGGGINFVSPKKRAFSLLNLDISFPFIDESISTATLVVVALVAPAVIIAAVTLLLVPGRNVSRAHNRAQTVRLKLWELEKGLAGLALSVATAFFVTQGMKNLFGKPRPDLLARCQPDLSNLAAHVVGGFGQDISARWTLVDVGICTQADAAVLDDGFRSFPSGHSSWSWSGLLYLSLFLCSKFAIAIPNLPGVYPKEPPTTTAAATAIGGNHEMLPLHSTAHDRESSKDAWPPSTPPASNNPSLDALRIRNTAAAPPNYLIVVAFIPIAVAIYIVSTRFAEYYHFGFDIISGSLIGILSAYFSFRWYHLPISRGQGWAWGARSRERAFAVGVGTGGYVGDEGWDSARQGGGGGGRGGGLVDRETGPV